MSDEKAPLIGQLVRDLRSGRVGVLMGREGGICQLRPRGGGYEWDVPPDEVEPVDPLGQRVAVINERSRQRPPGDVRASGDPCLRVAAVDVGARLRDALNGVGINTPGYAVRSPGEGAPVHLVEIGRLNLSSAAKLAKIIETSKRDRRAEQATWTEQATRTEQAERTERTRRETC